MSAAFFPEARVIVEIHREHARSYRFLSVLVKLAHQLRLSLGQAAGLGQFVDDYQNGNVRMGEDLHELRAIVAPLPDKLVQLEQRDPTSLSFAQAARLVGMGASVDELTQSCGLTQAEAEVMSKLHKN